MGCTHCGLPVPSSRRREDAEPSFCCFGCRLASELARPAEGTDGEAASTLVLRLGLGLFLAMNIMVFSWLHYARDALGIGRSAHDPLAELFAYVLLFLGTSIVATLGTTLLSDSLRGGLRVDANLLILVGVVAAYARSVVNTVRGEGALYYDTAAIILVLVTLGQYLDARARTRAARAARALLAEAPTRAFVDVGGDAVVEVEVERVARGQRVRVRAGEIIPVDGVVDAGRGSVDESSLTGESRPRDVDSGDAVMAGSVSLDGQLWVRADEVGRDRVVSRVERLLEEARNSRPEIQHIADRVARGFVPLVVVLAFSVLAVWTMRGNFERGLFDALAVLLISCPCALGLAAPLASWSALRRAARRGILIDSAGTLERAARIDRVMFDKTGTLTRPELRLDEIELLGRMTADEALGIAATVESASVHPLARELVAAAGRRGVPVGRATNAVVLAGIGVAADLDGRRYMVGREARAGVSLTRDDAPLARFTFAEQLRPGARHAVDRLHKMAIEVTVLTGDRRAAAERIGAELGVSVSASLLPEHKLHALERARQRGQRVAMVGDGLNDAPVLAAADVGFAVACGTDLAKQSGNVRLLRDRLDAVPETIAIARHTMRRIHAGLAWAFSYNLAGLALAATGHLSPVFAACAMVASSVFIVFLSSGAGAIGEPA